MTVNAFLEAVSSIADKEPVYREGGTGADGTCDCIGLVMGAMYALGRSRYDLHSSNYFARFQTEDLSELKDTAQLAPGMIVYKARTEMHDLNARYQPSGSCWTGDLLDYYHAGVVESLDPFSIVHCTSAGGTDGIVRDRSRAGWTHCGHVRGLAQNTEPKRAVVTARSGHTVNLRKRPEKNAPLIARVPLGAAVTVQETADGWAKVTAQGTTGYMMENFLRQESAQQQWVRLPLDKVLEMIETLTACAAEQTKEEHADE